MKKRDAGLVKSTIIITFCSILGILIGFISQLIIANYFGAKFERDSYFVASTIPTYLAAIFTGSIGVAFLPKVVAMQNGDKEALNRFLSSIIGGILGVSLLIGFLCVLFSKYILAFVGNGFDASQLQFTTKILVIILPTFGLGILTNLLSSLYQIENRFFKPAFAPILSSAISLLIVVLFSKSMGILALAYGFLIGSVISTFFLFPILKKYRIRPNLHLKDTEVLVFVRTFLPLLLTGLLFRSTGIFERSIASGLEPGSISFLGYSSQILIIMATLTANGVGVSIYPTMSKLWAENKKTDFSIFFSRIVRILLLISVPISLVICIWGVDFIQFVFERGAFNHHVTISVANALSWSMGAFVFQGLGNVVSKAFYISSNTRSISIIASFELIVYIALGYALSSLFSFVGLAIALSVSSAVNIFLSIAYIHKKMIPLNLTGMFVDFIKVLICSIISIVISYILYNFIPVFSGFGYLIVCLLTGGVCFYFCGLILNIEELKYLKHNIHQRLLPDN